MSPLRRCLATLAVAASLPILTGSVFAQDASDFLVPAEPASGLWVLGVGAGIGGHDNGPFSRRLQSYTPRDPQGERMLYKAGEFTNVGTTLNASAVVQVSSTFLLGASGELLSFPAVESLRAPGQPRDEYDLSGWGGGVDLGFFLVNEHRMMLFPFVHGGYYGYGLSYRNEQADSMRFFEGPPVAPGSSATYVGAAPRVGAGITLVTDLAPRSWGVSPSFFLIARIMYGTMLSRPEWQIDGEAVANGGLTPPYNALSLSIQIGIGGGAATEAYLE